MLQERRPREAEPCVTENRRSRCLTSAGSSRGEVSGDERLPKPKTAGQRTRAALARLPNEDSPGPKEPAITRMLRTFTAFINFINALASSSASSFLLVKGHALSAFPWYGRAPRCFTGAANHHPGLSFGMPACPDAIVTRWRRSAEGRAAGQSGAGLRRGRDGRVSCPRGNQRRLIIGFQNPSFLPHHNLSEP